MFAIAVLSLVFPLCVTTLCILEIRRSDRRLAGRIEAKLAARDEDGESPYTAESSEICCAECLRVEDISQDGQPA